MPLHLNLLAEALAEEEMRQRDPFKRAVIAGSVLVGLMLLWICLLQVKIMNENRQLSGIQALLNTKAKNYDAITQNQKKLGDISRKLSDLERLSTNRFLWGNLLNAMQKCIVPDVRLVAIRSEQKHIATEEAPKTNASSKTVVAKSGYVVEKMRLQFDARDVSSPPGDQVSKFKDKLSGSPYFRRLLGNANDITLRNLSPPYQDTESGKTIVAFTVDCRLPDKTLK